MNARPKRRSFAGVSASEAAVCCAGECMPARSRWRAHRLHPSGVGMNDLFKEYKARIRKLDEILVSQGLTNIDLARALSQVRRATRRGDRSREPTPELRRLLEHAEVLARRVG